MDPSLDWDMQVEVKGPTCMLNVVRVARKRQSCVGDSMCLHLGQRHVRKNHLRAMVLLSVWDPLFFVSQCFTSSCDIALFTMRFKTQCAQVSCPNFSMSQWQFQMQSCQFERAMNSQLDASSISSSFVLSYDIFFSPCVFMFTHRLFHIHTLIPHHPSILHWASWLPFSF